MAEQWERRRILIWGKTRPELSTTYREIVCTGGVFEDTGGLVRLYPIPLRFMKDSKVFKKYQWIEADVAKSEKDPRPESYRIRFDNISLGEWIKPRAGNWDARATWMLHRSNLFKSVEHLQFSQREDRTSLGIVKPKEVLEINYETYSAEDQLHFWGKYEEILSKPELPFEPSPEKEADPLTPPDYRFKIIFQCDDENCSGRHEFSVLDWETDALYFFMKKRGLPGPLAAASVVEKLRFICSDDHDLRFFLGNISTHPQTFTIVGLWWPKKHVGLRQGALCEL